jgi:hypothetical protein
MGSITVFWCPKLSSRLRTGGIVRPRLLPSPESATGRGDGSDGLIATRSYADDPVPGSTLTKKGDLDSNRPQERLRATQSTSKGASIPGPMAAVTALTRALDADSQGSAAQPVQELRSLISSRTQVAIGSASIMPWIAALRLFE